MALDIANIVNVTIQNVPAGLSEVNVNNLGFFTTEVPSNIDPYRNYTTASQVAVDYGTNSDTYAFANAVFSQSPNILSGNGSLVIMPLESSVSATSGHFVTANISANLSAIIAVNNGDLKVTVNGVVNNLGSLNFTACSTLADVAVILQRKLPDVVVTASSTALTFTSKTVGSSSSIALAAYSGGGTDLAGSGFFNTSSGTATAGANSSGETIVEALARVAEIPNCNFVPFITNLQIEDAVAVSTATAVQAMDKIWLHSWASISDLAGVITDINSAGNSKTRTLFYTNPSVAPLFRASYSGACFSVNFSASNTFSTMQLRSLIGIVVDDGITQSVYNTCHEVGADTYDNFNIPAVTTTRYGDTGLFVDQVYGQTWIKFGLQVNVFNVLKTSVIGVRQTQDGINQLLAGINTFMARAVNVGYIGTGLNWNSPYTFGNAENLRTSVYTAGYYIYIAPIATQSQTERSARQAPVIQIAYKEAGFINTVTILGYVEA